MCHVLIIEDEPLVAMDLENVLIEAGATSFAFASTEAEAVEQACARLPRVMTSDVRLTSGTGPAAVAIIRDRLGMIPVLFVSGTPSECGQMNCQDVVFSKPFDRADLAKAFRKILNGNHGAVDPMPSRL
jgi:CheY-like chemotaxis protein